MTKPTTTGAAASKALESILRLIVTRIDVLVRYVAPGAVSLIVASSWSHKYTETHRRSLVPIESVAAHPAAFLVTAAIIGLMLYTFSASIFNQFVWPYSARRALSSLTESAIASIKTQIVNRGICTQSDEPPSPLALAAHLNHERWLRRTSRHRDVRGVQGHITSWSTNTHFLYSAGLALMLTPIAIRLGSPCDSDAIGPIITPIIGGIVVLFAGFLSDRRNAISEVCATFNYPLGKPIVNDAGGNLKQ